MESRPNYPLDAPSRRPHEARDVGAEAITLVCLTKLRFMKRIIEHYIRIFKARKRGFHR